MDIDPKDTLETAWAARQDDEAKVRRLAAAVAVTVAVLATFGSIDQVNKVDEVKVLAEKDRQTYDSLNFRHDQFDLSDALLAIAIAMLAVTAPKPLASLGRVQWPMGSAALPAALSR